MKNKKNGCGICGKELSDPVSLKIGIGPVCRVQMKIKEYREKTGNLFSNSAKFKYWFDCNETVLAIEDLDSGRSVTNDIDNVLTQISEENDISFKRLAQMKIMYFDTLKIWDGINCSGKKSVSFYSLNEYVYEDALRKLLSKPLN